jgi:hemoglobin
MTREIEGIDEAGLQRLVARFYASVRADERLGPIFERAIDDWPMHLDKLAAFWSSVMLTSGRYKGSPMAAHLRHATALTPDLFDRWLALWRTATEAEMPPAAAAALQATAARIALSLQFALSSRSASSAFGVRSVPA